MTGRPPIPCPSIAAAPPSGNGSPRDLSVFGPWPEPSPVFARACQEPGAASRPESAPSSGQRPPAAVVLSLDELAALRFAHGYTDVFPEGSGARGLAIIGATRHGTTTWVAGRPAHSSVWVEWSWVHIQPGIVMLENPLELQSNIGIVGPQGQRLSTMESMIRLNCVIHSLGWHRVVRQASRPLPPCPR
jgi:hypothetical protein